jgi:hypothetical protein
MKDNKLKDDTITEVIKPIQDIKWYISWIDFVISIILSSFNFLSFVSPPWRWPHEWPKHVGVMNLCNKTNKCTCIIYIVSHIINYQHVSKALAIIIRVALQEYLEYIAQRCDKCMYYNVHLFHLHNLAVCCILNALVKLPWWWSQEWLKHVGD